MASGDLDTKTTRMLGLFMAALLVVTAGCGSASPTRAGHVHVDRNNDGYCDEDGEPMPSSGGHYYGGTYYGTPRVGSPGLSSPAPTAPGGSGHAATITGGTAAPHGGIGSTHIGGGG